jgi:Na+/H+-translocating membrane pyrophosphatase
MEEISRLIREGANTFLITQYKTIGVFAILFGVLIALVVEPERG